MISALAMAVMASVTSNATAVVSDLPGKVVAIWSKGAGKFVRSAGVEDRVLRADRKSYEANDEGRFLCFAEAGDTIAIMDVMLERYLTHTGGKLGSPRHRAYTMDLRE